MSWMVALANRQFVFKRDNDGTYRCDVFDNLVAEKFEPYLPRYRKTFYKGRQGQMLAPRTGFRPLRLCRIR